MYTYSQNAETLGLCSFRADGSGENVVPSVTSPSDRAYVIVQVRIDSAIRQYLGSLRASRTDQVAYYFELGALPSLSVEL